MLAEKAVQRLAAVDSAEAEHRFVSLLCQCVLFFLVLIPSSFFSPLLFPPNYLLLSPSPPLHPLPTPSSLLSLPPSPSLPPPPPPICYPSPPSLCPHHHHHHHPAPPSSLLPASSPLFSSSCAFSGLFLSCLLWFHSFSLVHASSMFHTCHLWSFSGLH